MSAIQFFAFYVIRSSVYHLTFSAQTTYLLFHLLWTSNCDLTNERLETVFSFIAVALVYTAAPGELCVWSPTLLMVILEAFEKESENLLKNQWLSLFQSFEVIPVI